MTTTVWTPKLWERCYRGVLIWVDETYAVEPKWEWSNAADGMTGCAASCELAQKAAEKYVDGFFARTRHREAILRGHRVTTRGKRP